MIMKQKKQVDFDVPFENVEHPEEDEWCIVSDDGMHVSEEEKRNDKPFPEVMKSENGTIWSHFAIPAILKKPQNIAALKKPQNLLLLLNVLVALIVISSLAWDRYSWRSSALRFEDELRHVTEREPKMEVLKEPVIDLVQPKDMKFDDVDWGDREDTILFDNCWGSFTIGECAREANDNLKVLRSEIKETVGKVAQHTWKAAVRLRKQATDVAKHRFPPALASTYYPNGGTDKMPKYLEVALKSFRTLSHHAGNLTHSIETMLSTLTDPDKPVNASKST